MLKKYYDEFSSCPVIPAVNDEESLIKAIETDLNVVFVLYGDLCTIGTIVKRLKEAGKTVLVHVDLINGLSAKEVAVDFVKTQTLADGVISTKLAVCQRASELHMLSVYRVFMLDSRAIETARKQAHVLKADVVEILPGVMPKIIKLMSGIYKCPVIAGGLIQDKEDVLQALDAGAISISTTNTDVWNM